MGRFLESLIFTSAFAAFAAGCGDECGRASDCAAEELCFKGLCTPTTSSRLSCRGNFECNSDPAVETLVCIDSRCIVPDNLGGGGGRDAGFPDTGVPADTGVDAGFAVDGAIFPDATPVDTGADSGVDTGVDTGVDSGILDSGPTDTGTVADAG